MTDHAAHAANLAMADDAAPAQTSGFATAATDKQGAALPASGHGPHAAETRRLYAADWAAFAAWCCAAGLAALPAVPATVAAYLGSLSATLAPGALARRTAAIADRHRRHGHPSPGTAPAVRAVLRAARRARGMACSAGSDAPAAPPPTALVRRPAPPGPAQLARMAAHCPGDLAGLRDRALLLLAAVGLDPERLLGLDHEHVHFTAQGAALAVSSAGTKAGEGVAIARTASAACPVRALQDWLRSSGTRFGPVFRKVDRWGNVEHRRLRPDALRRIWRRRAAARRSRRPAGTAP